MHITPDDYVTSETVMEVMAEHMKLFKAYKVRIFPEFVHPAKFAVTLDITRKYKLAYIGCRELLHEKCVDFVGECTQKNYNWQFYIVMDGSIYVFDPKTMLWSEFVEQMDQMMTGECPEYECCICFEKTDLIKCPQCTTRYCKRCLFGKTIDCFVCAASIVHDSKKKRVLVKSSNKIGMRLGCLFKLLHVKYGMETMHLLREFTSKDLCRVFMDLLAKEEYDKYFQAHRFWHTVGMFMEHVGLSSQVVEDALKTSDVPDEVAEILKNMKLN